MARNVCIYICIVIVLRYSDSMAYVVLFIQICMTGIHRDFQHVDDAVVFFVSFRLDYLLTLPAQYAARRL